MKSYFERVLSPNRGSDPPPAASDVASCAMSRPQPAPASAASVTVLRELYGRPVRAPARRTGCDELILTVLSQSTNDRNRDVAFLALRRDFAGWAAVRDAPNAEVERADPPRRHRGQGQVRAGSRRSCARSTSPRSTSTSRASRGSRRATSSVALPGVGRKTAACVLLFAYGMRDVPGRHARPAGRGRAWACSGEGAPFEELHDAMLDLTPRGQELESPREPPRATGGRTWPSKAPQM